MGTVPTKTDQTFTYGIVNYGSSRLLKLLVPTLAPHKVVVVDNFSSTEELSRIRGLVAAWGPRVRLLEMLNNGYGDAVNAISESVDSNDYVIMLNPDVSLLDFQPRRYLESVTAASLDVASPLILNHGGQYIWYAGGRVMQPEFRVIHENFGELGSAVERQVIGTEFVSGCALTMSPVARKLLPIPSDYFMYYEDVHFSLAAARAGLRLGVVLTEKLAHDEGATSRKDLGRSPLNYYYQSRNRHVCARLWKQRLRAALYSPLSTCRSLVRAVREPSDRRLKVRAVLTGEWHGLLGRSGRADYAFR